MEISNISDSINTFVKMMIMSESPSVLVCPLDWGIGHATRCVPVIRKFIELGYRVILAADGRSFEFLKNEVPGCRLIRFPGVPISYSGKWFALKMLLKTPSLLLGIYKEHHHLKKIIRDEKPDVIFSDNRYGLWSTKCKTIFMTHQLTVIAPGGFRIFSGIVNSILRCFIRKFDECWVPDDEGTNNLSGDLSHPAVTSVNSTYIGMLSRFIPGAGTGEEQKKYDFMAILSGPEPQRTVFEEIVFKQASGCGLRGIIVRGRTEESVKKELTEEIDVFSHLETAKMQEMMSAAEIVVCRPGYSTLMDLAFLGKKALLVPTPGQTEQEYLAKYLGEKKIFYSVSQDKFDLMDGISKAKDYPGMRRSNDYRKLVERINMIRKKIQNL
jgi:hypothetical protein